MMWVVLISVTDAFAQEPDIGQLANIPYLILGLMVAGALAGVAISAFVRKSTEDQQTEAAPSRPTPPPVAPPTSSNSVPGMVPMELAGGFDPSDDFEEPTCFAELPKKE